MKTCPYCGELLGDSLNECFKCHYNYTYKRVITEDEKMAQKNRQMDEQKRREEENRLKEEREERKKKQLLINPLFEYKVIVVEDISTGEVNAKKIQDTLDEWSENGWKLHSIFSSEIGKNSTAVSIAGFGTITNATIDQTILVFERCIKA